MISTNVAKKLVKNINDMPADVRVDEMIVAKINSGEFIVVTKKEYDGMLRAIKNFQKAKK